MSEKGKEGGDGLRVRLPDEIQHGYEVYVDGKPHVSQCVGGPDDLFPMMRDLAALREKVAALEASRARLERLLGNAIKSGWHRPYMNQDEGECEAPDGGECSCGWGRASDEARRAMEGR